MRLTLLGQPITVTLGDDAVFGPLSCGDLGSVYLNFLHKGVLGSDSAALAR